MPTPTSALTMLSIPNCLTEVVKLAIHRLQKDEVEFPGPNEFRQIDKVGKKEPLKDLADNLMGANQEDHLPLRPVANLVDVTEYHLDKDQLADKPKRFHDHPQEKIQLEIHLPNQGVAEHDRVD